MRLSKINRLRQDRDEEWPVPRWQLANMSYYVRGLPRLIVLCRLFGHRPVVDGIEATTFHSSAYTGPAYRWVCCGRCGIRSRPQGRLDPERYPIGARYHGPWQAPENDEQEMRRAIAVKEGRVADDVESWQLPGPVESNPKGLIGVDVRIGPMYSTGVGWEVKIGNAGSEHTLAASLNFGWLGGLYLHTERFGTGVQRRLNPVGYDSRLIGFKVSSRAIEWRLWSRRDAGYGPGGEPWWMHGHVSVRLLDKLLGPKQFEYTDVPGGTTTRLVRMPERDYLVELKLQLRALGRRRGRQKTSWSVDWNTLARGIPTKGPERGRVYGSGVTVSERSVRAGTWPAETAAAIVTQITADRTSHGWEPVGPIPVNVRTHA